MLRVLAKPAFSNRHHNPYQWLLYTRLAERHVQVEEFTPRRCLTGTYEILHLHWPQDALRPRSRARAVFRAAALLALVAACRARGTKVMWTVHNLRSHEGQHPRLEDGFMRAFVRLLDGYVCLSESGRQAAQASYPALGAKPAFVVPHGHYRDVYPQGTTRAAARQMLGLPQDARALACVGNIKPYKNVPALIRAFRGLQDPSAYLLVAGNPSTRSLETTLREAAGADRNIRLALDFIPGDRVQAYFAAADLAVLPFQEVLNSGSALLALSFDRPVLVPDRGALADLQEAVGPAWVRLYEPPLTAGGLGRALDWAVHASRPARAPLQALDWDGLAARTKAAYKIVVMGSGSACA